MKVTVVTKQAFKVSAWSLKNYNETELENTLRAFNSAGGGNFYFLDYYRKKAIVDSSSALILCGHSKNLADKQGFDFFQYVLSDNEWNWLNRVNEKCYEFFFNYPKNRHKDLSISYDLKLITTKGKEIMLRHNIVPYKLCQNGNVWLGLCHVWASPEKKSGNAFIFDRKTGEQYDFTDDNFVNLGTHVLTQEERTILKLMVQELSDEEIGQLLEISSVANLKRKKRDLYAKLDVGTSASAVHKAHLLGII